MIRLALASVLAVLPLAASAQQIVPSVPEPARAPTEGRRAAGVPLIEAVEQVPTFRGVAPPGFESFRFYPRAPQRAGDVNGDGKADLVYTRSGVADPATPSLSDAPGQTLLFFGPAEFLTPGQILPTVLTPVGDVDGDGLSDAYAPADGGTVLYRGTPSGYVRGAEVRVEGQPVVIEGLGDSQRARGFADLDGDGRADLVAMTDAGRSRFEAVVLLGSGGLVLLSPGSELAGATPFSSYVVADTDGDGRDEVVFSEETTDRNADVTTLLIRAASYADDGAFTVRELTRVSGDSFRELQPRLPFELADLDADGDLDLRRGSSLSDGIVFRNEAGTFDPDPYQDRFGRVVGDLDGDGAPDGILPGGDARTVSVGFGPAVFSDDRLVRPSSSQQVAVDTEAGYNLIPTGPYLTVPSGNRIGDLNGDGLDDGLVAVNVFEQSDQIGFGRVVVSGPAQGASASAVTYDGRSFPAARVRSTAGLGDVDGDGVDDFAVVHQPVTYGRDPRIEVFLGGRPATDGPALVLRAPAGAAFPLGDRSVSEVVGVDMDGDGTNDIVAGIYHSFDQRPFGGAAVWFGGDGLNDSADWYYRCAPSECEVSGGTGIYNLATGDVDGDGIEDVVLSGRQGVILRGGPRPDSSPSPFPASRTVRTPADYRPDAGFGTYRLDGLGDVDGDGSAEVLICDVGVQCEVAYGGDRLFQSPRVLLEGRASRGVANTHGDFNGDGVPDVALVDFDSRAPTTLNVFFGGSGLSTGLPDVTSGVLVDLFGTDEGFFGEVTGLPDLDGDGKDEILVANGGFGGRPGAYVLSGGSLAPLAYLPPPNTSVGLGADNNNILNDLHSAVGDFDGDGVTDVVLAQRDDTNDGAQASRVYRYRLDLAGAIAAEPAPGAFVVAVGPNPVRSSLRVTVALAAASEVTVDVVDVLGRRVAHARRPLAAGPGHVEVDVSGLASGTYVVRVRAGAAVGSRVVTVTR